MIKQKLKEYFINGMGAMAQGLFASLLIGTIFKALGMIPEFNILGLGINLSVLSDIGGFAQQMAGPAMAIAIAIALKSDMLVTFSLAAIGFMANKYGGAGGPLAVFIIAIISIEIGMLVSKKTKIDILITPFVTILAGGLLSVFCAPLIGTVVGYITGFIDWAAIQTPFVTGIIVSAVVGICLTLPISSAAICAALNLTGSIAAGGSEGLAIAGAAAVAGCCAQMVGFAVISFRDNKWGGLVPIGLGTSMLQMANIIKNPRIWIGPTLASVITGPLAVCVFNMRMYGAAINSGMGTCGMLGPIGIILGWFSPENGYTAEVTPLMWVGLILICFILPALLSYIINLILRRIGWVKDGDLKLS